MFCYLMHSSCGFLNFDICLNFSSGVRIRILVILLFLNSITAECYWFLKGYIDSVWFSLNIVSLLYCSNFLYAILISPRNKVSAADTSQCFAFFSFFMMVFSLRYWKSFRKILGNHLLINVDLGARVRHWALLLICWDYVFQALGQELWHF